MTKTNTTIQSAEYSKDLDGMVLTLSNGKVAHTQYNIESNILDVDYGERYLSRYDEYDSEDLTEKEQSIIDEYVRVNKWKQ